MGQDTEDQICDVCHQNGTCYTCSTCESCDEKKVAVLVMNKVISGFYF